MIEQQATGDEQSPAFIDQSEQYRRTKPVNAMSVDVEDYFQVSAFENHIEKDAWKNWPNRLPRNIDLILEMFEETGTKATFFTLGWACEQFPELIRRIVDCGHELASHGYDHSRVWSQAPEQFYEEVLRTRMMLEDVSGTPVAGFRAPSFSIGPGSMWAHDVLQQAGYRYSSSLYPIRHDHYGLPDAPKFPFRNGSGLLEIPMATITLLGRNWPCAGGGYFRLLPFVYSRWAIKRINDRDQMPAAFYFHPWELDPGQPRVPGLPATTRFRHYVNLSRFQDRLRRILGAFQWGRMDDIYLNAK